MLLQRGCITELFTREELAPVRLGSASFAVLVKKESAWGIPAEVLKKDHPLHFPMLYGTPINKIVFYCSKCGQTVHSYEGGIHKC